MKKSHLTFPSRHWALGALPFIFISTASAATVTATAISETEGQWTSTYPVPANPLGSFGVLIGHTFQTNGAGSGSAVASGLASINVAVANSAPVTFTWQVVWTPSNPSDTPTGPIVVQQRIKYTFTGAASSAPTGFTADVFDQFIDSLGLGTIQPPVDSGATNLPPINVNQNTWVYGLNATILSGPVWVLQPNGTYVANVVVSDIYGTRGGGTINNPGVRAKSIQLAYGTTYSVQTTLLSVGGITLLPYDGQP